MLFLKHALKMVLSPWLLLLVGVYVLLQVMPAGLFPRSEGEKRAEYLNTLTAGLAPEELAALLGQAEGGATGCGYTFDEEAADAALSHVQLRLGDVQVGGRLHDYWRSGVARGVLDDCNMAMVRFGPSGTAISELLR